MTVLNGARFLKQGKVCLLVRFLVNNDKKTTVAGAHKNSCTLHSQLINSNIYLNKHHFLLKKCSCKSYNITSYCLSLQVLNVK